MVDMGMGKYQRIDFAGREAGRREVECLQCPRPFEKDCGRPAACSRRSRFPCRSPCPSAPHRGRSNQHGQRDWTPQRRPSGAPARRAGSTPRGRPSRKCLPKGWPVRLGGFNGRRPSPAPIARTVKSKRAPLHAGLYAQPGMEALLIAPQRPRSRLGLFRIGTRAPLSQSANGGVYAAFASEQTYFTTHSSGLGGLPAVRRP